MKGWELSYRRMSSGRMRIVLWEDVWWEDVKWQASYKKLSYALSGDTQWIDYCVWYSRKAVSYGRQLSD